MARINTSKMLSNDGYFSSVDNGGDFGQAMTVSPVVSDQYDYALTEDIVLLNERKDTAEKIYEIWVNSPFYDQYSIQTDPQDGQPPKTAPKIPKEEISKIFYYVKNQLQKKKKLTMQELVIAINEFFEFNYEYIIKKVISPKIKAEILEDYYHNGMKQRMDNNIAEKLF